MKKLFIIFLMAVAFAFSANAQQWVGFTTSTPGFPEVNLLTSNAQSVSFEVTIPGIYTLDTVVGRTAFKRLFFPKGNAVNSAGFPELPVLKYQVAIPECDAVVTGYNVLSTQTMPSCWVYPKPEMVLNSNRMFVEQFTFNPSAYTIPRANDPAAIISSSGALRSQKYTEVTVYPIEFCPVTRQLSVIDKIEVTLTFTNPQGNLRQNLGTFNSVATTAFINYEDDGTSAVINDKAFLKPNFTRGNVQWITLNDTAQAKNIIADYLIICAEPFFTSQNVDIQRLTNHRATYNGYDVAIVNVENILSLPFKYEGNPDPLGDPDKFKTEQKLRMFIRRVYEGKNAHNSHNPYGDGHLAYVLFVGDALPQNSFMPTSFDHPEGDISNFYRIPSDYYFSCITRDSNGEYDKYGDLYIGRMSVQTPTQLYNMVQKTIYHETVFDGDQSWHKTTGHIHDDDDSQFMVNLYNNFVKTLSDEIEWDFKMVSYYDDPVGYKDSTINCFNKGVVFLQYNGLSGIWNWDKFTIYYFQNKLNNAYKAPFVNHYGNNSGLFSGDGLGFGEDCVAEAFTNYSDTKGAVGYIGPSVGCGGYYQHFIDTTQALHYKYIYTYYLLKKKSSIAGELLLKAKLNCEQSMSPNYLHVFNLFGDPALNILAQGYEVTQNVTAECPAEIRGTVRVRNGATLTIPDSCTLTFHENGKLIIEEGGNLVIGAGAKIVGVNNSVENAIHVKGGGFSVGWNVTFQDLSGGILLENAQNAQGIPFYDANIEHTIVYVTFKNTPITHQGSKLNLWNCTFKQGSSVKTSTSFSYINGCTFHQSTFSSDQTFNQTFSPFHAYTTVTYCNFYGDNFKPAIQIINSRTYFIYANTIYGGSTGISITGSGISLCDFIPALASIISHNNISFSGAGIEVFNSIANITSNTLTHNIFGVRLFNNSTTVMGTNFTSPVVIQTIQDCDSIELYASNNSFPTIFRYNQVIDENNGGNSVGDPLVWWDFIPQPGGRVRYQVVNQNYWGENFNKQDDLYPPQYFICDTIWDRLIFCHRSGADETLFQAGLDFFSAKDYPAAEATFKEVIETYPDSRFAIAAMHELFALEHYTNQDYYSLNNYFASFTPADSNLFNTADFLATRCHVKEKNWQPAVDWYENRIENPPSYQDSIFAVIDLGALHLIMEGDTVNGAKSNNTCRYRLAEVKPASKQAYETHKTALLATLPQIKKPQTEKPQNPATSTHKKGALGECIPNPTNGNATIFYELFTDGSVEIQVFNAMGQLVKSISIGTSVEGNHQVKISLSGVPAGLYHYTLLVNGEKADAKKLVVTE